MRRFARHLINVSALENSEKVVTSSAFPVTDTLRPHLKLLMGTGGTRQLLVRAITLAKVEVSWLHAVRVTERGELEGFDQIRSLIDPAEFLEGRVILLAQLLGLLVAFIGPTLTSRMVGEFWPQIPFRDRNFGEDDQHEKAS